MPNPAAIVGTARHYRAGTAAGRDVVDALAESDDRLALSSTSDSRTTRRYLFSDVSRLSSQYAQVMKRAGIRAGDRVLEQLPRVPEWQVAMTACAKLEAASARA